AAAAAARRLNQHRVTDLVRDRARIGEASRRVRTVRHRHARGPHQFAYPELTAEGFDQLRRWADEDEAGVARCPRERWIFGQKAVARVQRVGADRLRGSDQLVDREVTLDRGRGADVHAFVRQLYERQVFVRIGVDRDRCDAEIATRA